ncbi:ubiquitin carboxyl-terminal hydrolase 15 [Galendromus occidentalis]|uniref:Ubiquitin carboxyl-terminal hydrolase n=1 Tax=Galendromus occidentalis TaxID=34638 RepID=A0AAJ6QMT0_9ACAR|nr:ubiquitin carboxyl-terminal hydrolase 15 [Galendromus occidentalis]
MTVSNVDDHREMTAGPENGEGLEYQKDFIGKMIKKPLAKGDHWYLLDHKWFKQWKKYVGFNQWETGSVGEPSANPGPINNSGLLIEHDNPEDLREHLIDELDYVLMPEEAWTKLVEWYGLAAGQKPIARTVVDFGMFLKNLKVEIYRMELKLCLNPNLKDAKTYRFSKVATVEEVEKVCRKLFNVPESAKTRLWNRFSTNTLEIMTEKNRTIQDESLYSAQILVLEVQNPDGTWPRNSSNPPDTRKAVEQNYMVSSAAGSKIPSYSSTGAGLCGLTNLGNTCFMNSALQCMSNTPVLTEYFLSDMHVNEINRDNPLGMHGEIAESYANLIKAMWSGNHTSFALKVFKQKVGRFAPQFNGYMQQDCQELMSFLLDGLHEDLNRVKKKPYIEAKNSEGRPDHVLAKEAWSNYLKRNDSIVVDTFHGLLKSTLVCPECDHVSVTFDPFCYLSLPLPNRKERVVNVIAFMLTNPRPIKLRINVPPDRCTWNDFYSMIVRTLMTKHRNLVIAQVCADKTVERVIEPSDDKFEETTDSLHVYETPCWPWKGAGSLVRVYTRVISNNQDSDNAFTYAKIFGVPFYVYFQNRMTTVDAIYNTCLSWLKGRFVSPKEVQAESDEETQMEVDTEDGKEERPEKFKQSLFEVNIVNEMANTRMPTARNHVRLEKRAFVTLDCLPEVKEAIFEESKCTSYMSRDHPRTNRSYTKQPIELSECLDLFTTMEQLGTDDLWFCPVCKKQQQATKRFNLWSLPPILIIHLKRFSFNRYFREKLDVVVNFPVKDLSMGKWVLDPKHKSVPYDLIGVANHTGNLGAGHYTAYAKNKITKKWNHFDDLNVSSISENDIVSKQAYVLFYQRREDPTSQNGSDAEKGASSTPAEVNQAGMDAEAPHSSQANNSSSSFEAMDDSGIDYEI